MNQNHHGMDNMSNSHYPTVAQTTVDPWYDYYLPLPLPRFVIVAFVLLCLTGCVVGCVGNILVILAILKKRKLRSSANAFLVSLAVADLGTCVLVLPILAVAFVSLEVVTTNQLLCRLFYHTTFTFSPVSIQHLILIAANRYTLINKSPRTYTRLFNRRTISVIIPCVWIANIVLNLFIAIFSYGTKQLKEKEYCRVEQGNTLGVVFWLFTISYTFLSCFVIIPIFYVLTFWTVRKSRIRVAQSVFMVDASTVATASIAPIRQSAAPNRLTLQTNQQTGPPRSQRQLLSPSEVKLTKVNFLIFLTNVLFLSPMFFALVISGELTHGTFSLILLPIGMNSSTNPLVYCGFNRNFRLAFKSLIKLQRRQGS